MSGLKDYFFGAEPYFPPTAPAREPNALPADIPEDVAALFEKFSFEIMRAGMAHYSARAILHQIRWHHYVERGNREFKCNDHWTPFLARWFMAKYPQHDGFFETRIQKSLETTDDNA